MKLEKALTETVRRLSIRPAAIDDVARIVAFDQVAQRDPGHRAYIQNAIEAGTCHVAVVQDRMIAYLVFNYSFYEQGFIATLYVHATYRRQGVGAALMRFAEAHCTTPKLFTSTNLSNQTMQALLAGRGYKLSGVIHDLDEGDPELVYVKYLRGG